MCQFWCTPICVLGRLIVSLISAWSTQTSRLNNVCTHQIHFVTSEVSHSNRLRACVWIRRFLCRRKQNKKSRNKLIAYVVCRVWFNGLLQDSRPERRQITQSTDLKQISWKMWSQHCLFIVSLRGGGGSKNGRYENISIYMAETVGSFDWTWEMSGRQWWFNAMSSNTEAGLVIYASPSKRLVLASGDISIYGDNADSWCTFDIAKPLRDALRLCSRQLWNMNPSF